jgi:hypothetical protein
MSSNTVTQRAAGFGLHTCLDELQPKTNGALNRTGSGRMFATVTQLTRTKRPGRPDFVRGTARCFQLRTTVVFDTYSIATTAMHFGPVVLPPRDASALVKRKTVLYGMVVKTARGFRFSRCTAADELYFFFTSAFRPTQFLVDNADALHIDGKSDLFALATLLQGSFDAVLDPLERAPHLGFTVALSWPPLDFVVLASMLVRDARLYHNFVSLVRKRRGKLHRAPADQLLAAVIPAECLQEYIDRNTNDNLSTALNTGPVLKRSERRPRSGQQPDPDPGSDSDLSC